MHRLLRTAGALVCAALLAAPVMAQTLTGAIAGTVTDEQGAVLPGVTVTLTGKQGSTTQVTDANGSYRFVALEVGTYQVEADLSGFQKATRPDLQISPGRELTIDLQLKIGGLTETVTVSGESPVVDVKSSATETTISQSLLYSAPITRTAINVINYAPGVNDGSAYGGDSDSGNALLIDGVDTRDPSGGTAWTFYNYNIVEEYQFQGLGAPAEYGGFTGAVVNTITKSGGNRFSGLFDVFGTNKSLGSDNTPADIAAQNPSLADPAVTRRYADITTQIGGPIQQNKLFFFASAQRFLLVTDPTGPITTRHEVSPRLNFKLNWQPNPSNNFTGHVQFDAYNIIGRPGVSSLIATDDLTVNEDAPEYVWMLQWRHLFNASTFSEVKYTGWTGFYDLNPVVNQPGHFDGLTGLYSVSAGFFYYADRGRDQVNASVTHYADKFGRHELKFGAEIEHSTTRDRYGFPDGLYFYDYGGAPYYAYNYSYDISAVNTRQSVFAQDSWQMTDRLTANVGVRGDMLQGKGKDTDRVYSSSNWAPRLGLAWDLAGDNRTVLRGSYGWYYEGSQTALFTRALPGIADYITYAVNPDFSLGDIVDVAPSIPYKVADDIKHPRVDEATVAFERALSGTMRLTLTGIWRDNKNFVNSVNPSARWLPVTTTDENGNPITLYNWANRDESDTDYVIRNVNGFQYLDPDGNVIGTADPFRKYRAFMAVLRKAYTNRWQAQISYVFAKTNGNVDNSGGQQIATRQFETPNLALVNAEGNLTYTPRHEFKLLGSYQIPRVEASVNAVFRATSGLYYTHIEQFPNSLLNALTAYRRIRIEPLGARQLPSLYQFDVRFEKSFRFPGSNRLDIYADIENLVNRGGITDVITRSTSVALPDGTSFDLPFNTPGAIQAPRQVRIGARWSF
ncbi:MAG TPA: TonB-dependent receptor [Vicinamibacterales bacterium]|nr:TonB-dependent receptor [Vicinamibacterales bacterium]